MLVVGLLAGIAAAVVISERDSKQERLERPITEASKTLLPYRAWKNTSSKQVIVFVHGWPDDANVFERLATKLSKDYNCFSINLPGYPLPPKFDGNKGTVPERKWGFTIEECVIALKATVEHCCSEVDGCSGITLVTHDWGAIFGYLLDHKYPQLIQRMVSLDVGWRFKGTTTKGLLITLLYQGFLNLCFLMPSFIGSVLTALLSQLLGRTPARTSGPVTGEMNWPYRAAWRDTFSKGFMTRMNRYKVTEKPRLFIYSNKTNPSMRFSDDAWCNAIEKSYPGVSQSVPFAANHWMMNTHPAEIEALIEDWLKHSQSATGPRT